MRIEVDILDYAMEEVLLIEYKNGWWRLVAYLSKFLNETERNYKIYNKKILVMIKGLENWRHLLKNTKFKFEIWTDYKNFKEYKSWIEDKSTILFFILTIYYMKHIGRSW